ncbi:hypothetical protein FRC00_011085, partial [Tulasnella sp. 408]
ALNNLNNKFLDQPGGRLKARTSSSVNQICAPTSFDNLGLVLVYSFADYANGAPRLG